MICLVSASARARLSRQNQKGMAAATPSKALSGRAAEAIGKLSEGLLLSQELGRGRADPCVWRCQPVCHAAALL